MLKNTLSCCEDFQRMAGMTDWEIMEANFPYDLENAIYEKDEKAINKMMKTYKRLLLGQ